eukprot:COSAG01_NODE_11994_length_1820_cov_1.569436_3_plen_167_part_00
MDAQTVQRAALVNAAELVTYDYLHTGIGEGSGLAPQLVCASVAGVAGSVVSTPLDVLKTRVMCQGARVFPSPVFLCVCSRRVRGSRTPCTSWSLHVAIRGACVGGMMADAKDVRYKGSLDCARRILATEGVRALAKGFGPYVARNVPWTVTFFVSLEQFKALLLHS